MTDLDLTLLVIAADAASLAAFDRSHLDGCELLEVVNTDGHPLSALANARLDAQHRSVFGLCHADAVFGPGALRSFTRAALGEIVCGIVGRNLAGEYRWCHTNPGEVSTLDCCAVFLPPGPLRFDAATFDGFHCHVEDICLQARAAGLPVAVPLADATHRLTTANGEAFLNEYWRYRQKLARKWAGTRFLTT